MEIRNHSSSNPDTINTTAYKNTPHNLQCCIALHHSFNSPNRHLTPNALPAKLLSHSLVYKLRELLDFAFPAAFEVPSPLFISLLETLLPAQLVLDFGETFVTEALPGNIFCSPLCSVSQLSSTSKLAHTPSAVIPCSLLSMAHTLRATLPSMYSHFVLGLDTMEPPLPMEIAFAYRSDTSRRNMQDTTSARPTTLATCN